MGCQPVAVPGGGRIRRRRVRRSLTALAGLSPEGRDAFLYACSAMFAGVTAFAMGIPLYRQWGQMAVGPYAAAALIMAVVAVRVARTRARPARPRAVATVVATTSGPAGIAPASAAPGSVASRPVPRAAVDRRPSMAGRPGRRLRDRAVRGHHRPAGPGGGLALGGRCRPARPARGGGGGAGRGPGRPRPGSLPGGRPERSHPHPSEGRADLRAVLPLPAGNGGVRVLDAAARSKPD